DDDRVRVAEDFDPLGRLDVLDVDGLVDLQLADVDADRVGDGDGQALHLQAVQRLVEDAAGGDARGDAAQLNLHVDLDALVARDALEIDVEDFLAEVVVLQLDNLGRLDALVGLQVDDTRAVADGLSE